MAVATRQTAHKRYTCSKCWKFIEPGQIYYKRRESGKVHNRMTYWNIEWHADSKDCLVLKD